MLLEYFQMIDAIEELAPDEGRLVARAKVPSESPVFEGHFPGYPLVPGVLLIETMAQASGYLILSRLKFKSMPFLASVSSAKMRSFVAPDADLLVEAQIDHDGSGFTATRARISCDGKRICDTQLILRIMAFPNDELKNGMLARFREINCAMAG